jgi:hypothetical protein
MIKSNKLLVIAASLLALATGAQAQVALSPNVSASGYAAASWTHVNSTATDRLDIDSALLKFTGKSDPVTGVVSFYYVPGSAVPPGDSDLHVLDAHVTWNIGSGWTVQGGRFLSWMGYESFFTINNPEISGANTAAVIPGYEDGIRLVYTEKDWNAGVALVDSTFGSPSAFKGDGELKTDYGVEAYASYSGITDTTIWLGVAYQSVPGPAKAAALVDLYAQYQVSKDLYVAGEITVTDNVLAQDAETWLLLANYTYDNNVSVAFRVSGDTYNGPVADDIKYTLAPTYKVNDAFSVRAEVSYTNVYGKVNANPVFLGVQALYKF